MGFCEIFAWHGRVSLYLCVTSFVFLPVYLSTYLIISFLIGLFPDFFFIFVFSIQIRTTDFWCQKQPLCQLTHKHCPIISFVGHNFSIEMHLGKSTYRSPIRDETFLRAIWILFSATTFFPKNWRAETWGKFLSQKVYLNFQFRQSATLPFFVFCLNFLVPYFHKLFDNTYPSTY